MNVHFENGQVFCDTRGFYTAFWGVEGCSTMKMSTFFPDEWTPEKVIQKIEEALENPIREPYQDRDTLVVEGMIKEGILIKILLETDPENNCKPTGKILIAFPVLD